MVFFSFPRGAWLNASSPWTKFPAGHILDVIFAASSLTAVLRSLMSHKFDNQLDTQIKLPEKFHRGQQGNLESQLTSENYYKGSLNVPTVEDITQKLKDIFSEQYPKSCKC
ncbi:hypothetical protein GH733_004309 [Mirounga leonina]|nr:hypothetical protein GH733_004309 [Mirounga leonina]